MTEPSKQALDGAIVAVSLASPWWLQALQQGVGLFMLLGGAVLLALRLAIAWREWRQGQRNGD